MNRINIYWGSDSDFDFVIDTLADNYKLIGDLLAFISKQEFVISGVEPKESPPLTIENLVIHTDDYGSLKEWALLGFSNSILENSKVLVENLYLNNPPQSIYNDLKKKYKEEIVEKHTSYQDIDLEILKKISTDFNSTVIGQDRVIKQVLPALYSLKNPKRARPVTLLFLGDSGIGKTETGKYISTCLNGKMVRVQFSMQQTNEAYQFIFGGEHGEDSLAREMIRRETNVILLDEFDKVSHSFYNAFYQMFDEGIFVDSNYAVNVEKCIIICTTNYTSEEEAEDKLGAPIYSRFSKVIKFNPIKIEDKIIIAEKIYQELFSQLEKEDKNLLENNQVLSFYKQKINNGIYKNMRMLKNDIENALNFEIPTRLGIINN